MKEEIIKKVTENLSKTDWDDVKKRINEFYKKDEKSNDSSDLSDLFKGHEDEWLVLGNISKAYDAPYEIFKEKWDEVYLSDYTDDENNLLINKEYIKIFEIEKTNNKLKKLLNKLYRKHVTYDRELYPGNDVYYLINIKGDIKIYKEN